MFRLVPQIACLAAVVLEALIHGTVTADADAASPARWRALQQVARQVPQPLRDHPGNVFVKGETVTVPLPPGAAKARHWRVLDERLAEGGRGKVGAVKRIEVGALPVGWYQVEFLDETEQPLAFTTAAVLAALAEPVPQDSPVCLDVALSWLAEAPATDFERLSNLAALAGANWVRDRIRWREVQRGPDDAIEGTKYDDAADIQHRHGLKVLQAFHTAPEWARDSGADPEHPRINLRHLYAFCKAMAQRFEGRVQAWEPWNEGNAGNFGGMTIDEMCSLQC